MSCWLRKTIIRVNVDDECAEWYSKGTHHDGAEWNINKHLNCNSYNVIYAIFVLKEKCKQVYIGETKRMLRFRLADHCGYITNGDVTQATGAPSPKSLNQLYQNSNLLRELMMPQIYNKFQGS